MKVRQVENFKIPNAELRETTQEELQREFDYYRAQMNRQHPLILYKTYIE